MTKVLYHLLCHSFSPIPLRNQQQQSISPLILLSLKNRNKEMGRKRALMFLLVLNITILKVREVHRNWRWKPSLKLRHPGMAFSKILPPPLDGVSNLCCFPLTQCGRNLYSSFVLVFWTPWLSGWFLFGYHRVFLFWIHSVSPPYHVCNIII